MSLQGSWHEYVELTKQRSPRKLLVKALPFVQERTSALDLGAGALNDSIYLLSENFRQVTAIDKEPVAEEIAKTLPRDRFSYVISSLEDFEFKLDPVDLVNAQYSLPFIQPDQFLNAWERIGDTLKTSGIFTGQFFGDRDEWKGSRNMTFHTEREARQLLAGYDLLHFEEEESDKPTAAGIMKHWHVFHFIARKQKA